MKKTYINPEIMIVNVLTTQMIAISNFDESLDNNGGDGGNSLGREINDIFYDDDDL